MIVLSLIIDGDVKEYYAIVIGQYLGCIKSGLALIAILTLLPCLVLIVLFGLKEIEL